MNVLVEGKGFWIVFCWEKGKSCVPSRDSITSMHLLQLNNSSSLAEGGLHPLSLCATVNSPFLFYNYMVATYSFMLMFTALSIQQQGGEGKKKKQPAILLHHNHYGPFHMGERNFIIAPAGTVKTKLMNTESFLVAALLLYSAAVREFSKPHSSLKSNTYSAHAVYTINLQVMLGSLLWVLNQPGFAGCRFELKSVYA